jgi:UDP-N-acetylmuramate--alanine ligase
VARRAREGDVVVTMGAPPISLMGDELLAALSERAAEGRGYVARHARPDPGPVAPGLAPPGLTSEARREGGDVEAPGPARAERAPASPEPAG